MLCCFVLPRLSWDCMCVCTWCLRLARAWCGLLLASYLLSYFARCLPFLSFLLPLTCVSGLTALMYLYLGKDYVRETNTKFKQSQLTPWKVPHIFLIWMRRRAALRTMCKRKLCQHCTCACWRVEGAYFFDAQVNLKVSPPARPEVFQAWLTGSPACMHVFSSIMVTMVTIGGDLQPGCLADRLLTGLGQPQINP
jgi:hypothetical protein